LPAILSQTMAWVLGEYGYLSQSVSTEEIMEKLCVKLLHGEREHETKATAVTALAKLIAQSGKCPSKVLQTLNFYAQSQSLDLQQRCLEVLALLKHSETMADVLPVDASCEDIDMDESLSIVNAFVHIALQRGAKPYARPVDWDGAGDDESDKKSTLKVTPYAAPRMPVAATPNLPAAPLPTMTPAAPTTTPLSPALANVQVPSSTQGNQLLGTRGNAVWGKKMEPVPAPVPVVQQQQQQQPMTDESDADRSMHASSFTSSSTAAVQLIPAGNNIWSNSGASTLSVPSNTLAPPATPAVLPAAPRELTEKEKMAQALFGGVNKPAATGSKRRTSTVTPTPAAAAAPAAAPAAAAPVAVSNDLFSGMSAPAPVVPSSSSVSSSSHVGPQGSLLDMSDDIPTHIPVRTFATTATTPHMMANMLDFSTPSVSSAPPQPPVMQTPFAPSPAPPVAPQPVATSVISDVFGNLDLSGAVMTTSSPVDAGLRPLPINTAEFGRRWGTCRSEAKQSVSLAHWSRLDLDNLRRALPPTWHHVESIPNTHEAIFAAMSGANPATSSVLLLHIKLQPARRACDVLVKSSSQELSQHELVNAVRSIDMFRC
jgi:AP-4 complex subunit epsilon-1